MAWIFADEILFRWAPEKQQLLREFWEDFALVLETLEENQVRIFYLEFHFLKTQLT